MADLASPMCLATSASCPSRHFGRRPTTSGPPLETDIVSAGRHVSKVPLADTQRRAAPACCIPDCSRINGECQSNADADAPVIRAVLAAERRSPASSRLMPAYPRGRLPGSAASGAAGTACVLETVADALG